MMTQGNAFTKGVASLAAAMLLAGGLATVGSTTADATSAAPPVPDTAKLAGELANQELVWEKCDYGSSTANTAFDVPNVECATVKVPRDWFNPDPKKTWDIRVSQAKNVEVGDEKYKGTIFTNPGGPGGHGLPFASANQTALPELKDNYNFVAFDPRGVGEDEAYPTYGTPILVGQSSQVKCDYEIEIDGADPNSEKRGIAEACSMDQDVKTINTEQTVYDMDFIRNLLGAPKLSYLGYSYGTWLGAWYSKVFTKKYADKMVLDSAVDVSQKSLQHAWDYQPYAQDRALTAQIFPAIVRNYPEYETVEDVKRAYLGLPEELRRVAGLIAAEESNGSSTELMSVALGLRAFAKVNDPQRLSDTELIDVALEELGRMDNGKYQEIAAKFQNQFADMAEPPEQSETVKGTFTAAFEVIRCNDGQWNQDLDFWETHRKNVADKTMFDYYEDTSVPICAFWTASAEMPTVDPKTYPKTLAIQAELDRQTAWEIGYETGVRLPRTSFIAVDNESAHGVFPYGKEGVDRPVKDFFATGKLPTNISMVQGKPLVVLGLLVDGKFLSVEEDVTYEAWEAFRENAHHDGKPVDSVWQVAEEFGEVESSEAQVESQRARDTQQAHREMKEFVFSKYGQRGQEELADG